MRRGLALAVLALLAACSSQSPESAAGPVDGSGSIVSSGGKGDAVSRAAWVREQVLGWNAELSEADRALKFEKMAESPYGFFRGTNHLFWADLGRDPRLEQYGSADARTFVQGDLHALNFGSFHDDDGQIVYDLNDFDEAFIADYQLDVWRMAVSIVLVGRQNHLSEADVREGVDAFVEAYLDALADYDGNGDERDRSFTADDTWGRLDDFLEDVADHESRGEMLDDWTVVVHGWRLLDTDLDKLEYLDDDTWYAVAEALGEDEYGATLSGGLTWDADVFAVKDVAGRLRAGTGSLGTPRYYVLLEGPTDSPDDDVILDVKRQGRPTGVVFGDEATRVRYDTLFSSDAERAVEAQRALLTDTDDYLGWITLADGTYSVRERSPFKDELPLDALTSANRLVKVCEQWGLILATDHARADRDFRPDLVPASFEDAVDDLTDGHHAEFRDLVWEVASAYADQVAADYDGFLEIASAR